MEEKKDAYRVLLSDGEGEFVEKKSRFIATTLPISSQEEALEFIEKTKKQSCQTSTLKRIIKSLPWQSYCT